MDRKRVGVFMVMLFVRLYCFFGVTCRLPMEIYVGCLASFDLSFMLQTKCDFSLVLITFILLFEMVRVLAQ